MLVLSILILLLLIILTPINLYCYICLFLKIQEIKSLLIQHNLQVFEWDQQVINNTAEMIMNALNETSEELNKGKEVENNEQN